MGEEGLVPCRLDDLARAHLREQEPDEDLERPTSLFWQVLDPTLRNTLMNNTTLGYVVTSPVITESDVAHAITHAVDIGLERAVIYGHQGASVLPAAEQSARAEGVEVVLLREEGCSEVPSDATPLRLVVKDLWSPDLNPPSTGGPLDERSFSVFVQVAVGDGGPGSEVFHLTVASRDRLKDGLVHGTMVLDRFSWNDVRGYVQQHLDLVSRRARTWRDVISALAPFLEYSDELSEDERGPRAP